MKQEIEIESRVRMLNTTQYGECDSNPRDCDGTVTDIKEYGEYSVVWDNGQDNGSYTDTDIGLIVPTINNNYSIF